MKYYLVGEYQKHGNEEKYHKGIPFPQDDIMMNRVDKYIREVKPDCGKVIFSEGEMYSDTFIVKDEPYRRIQQYINFYFNQDMILEKENEDGKLIRSRIDFVTARQTIHHYEVNRDYYSKRIQG
jgi:hypothetical protein